jgi:16S rRNA (guanine(966)-N(2))-methyltransferase RsmD
VRIISGSAKGRRLAAVPGAGTRPVTGKVKGALFNILGRNIEGATFLDLFAGTGSVGIEALSRGARHVVFVDRGHRAIDTIRRNLAALDAKERAEVIYGDAFHYLKNAPPELLFDYVYVAPPQYQELWAQTLLALNDNPHLAADGLIIVQIHPKEFRELDAPRLRLLRERRYGSTMLCFYALSERVGVDAGEAG